MRAARFDNRRRPPGSGKTTLARKLAKDLGILAVSKDDIMERLWDAFKWDGDQAYLAKFRDGTYDLLFYIAAQAGRAGKDVMLDSNFDHHFATQKILSIVEAHNFGRCSSFIAKSTRASAAGALRRDGVLPNATRRTHRGRHLRSMRASFSTGEMIICVFLARKSN